MAAAAVSAIAERREADRTARAATVVGPGPEAPVRSVVAPVGAGAVAGRDGPVSGRAEVATGGDHGRSAVGPATIGATASAARAARPRYQRRPLSPASR